MKTRSRPGFSSASAAPGSNRSLPLLAGRAAPDGPSRRMFLDELCSGNDDPRLVPPLALIVAHPDDESIGAGARLPRWNRARFVHVTDGAPLSPGDARAAGFSTRAEYAQARKHELLAALAMSRITRGQEHGLGFGDQEASFHLEALTERILEFLRSEEPQIVLTHPYEGGHPDHDATAFAVHAARGILSREQGNVPLLLEMTSYHAGPQGICAGRFLPNSAAEQRSYLLSAAEREFKRRLLACFPTQAATVAYFPVGVERFRFAPVYDFALEPHGGRLFYENYDWGVTGSEWRKLARRAAQCLDLETRL